MDRKLLLIGGVAFVILLGVVILRYPKKQQTVVPFSVTPAPSVPITNQTNQSQSESSAEDNQFPVPPNYLCDEHFPKDLSSNNNALGYYGGVELNGCVYNALTSKVESRGYWQTIDSCEDTVQQEIASKQYRVLNGCLYKGNDRVFEHNLLIMVQDGDFGEEYVVGSEAYARRGLGEYAVEWFRFVREGKLHIFLKGGAGCGGCAFNGPYIVIDLSSGTVRLDSADLPYLPNLVLSPDHKHGITFDYQITKNEEGKLEFSNVRLISFDFVTFLSKPIVTIPDSVAVLEAGMGEFFAQNAVTWKSNSLISVQPYKGSIFTNGVWDENNHATYESAGKSFTVSIQ